MSDKNSCIYLSVILPINYVISFILRNFGVKQYCSVIEFCYFGLFPLTVNLDLFGISFGGTSKPCLCYP